MTLTRENMNRVWRGLEALLTFYLRSFAVLTGGPNSAQALAVQRKTDTRIFPRFHPPKADTSHAYTKSIIVQTVPFDP
jgi:hypothetical protein